MTAEKAKRLRRCTASGQEAPNSNQHVAPAGSLKAQTCGDSGCEVQPQSRREAPKSNKKRPNWRQLPFVIILELSSNWQG